MDILNNILTGLTLSIPIETGNSIHLLNSATPALQDSLRYQ